MKNATYTLKDVLLLIVPVLTGVGAIGAWWYELHIVIGWEGNAWLDLPLRTIYGLLFLVVMTFLIPLMVELKMPFLWGFLYALLLYAVSYWAFFAAYNLFEQLYSQGVAARDERQIAFSIWKLLGIVITTASVYFVPLRHFLRTTDGMHVLTIMVAFISVIPASIICIEHLPLWSTKTAFIDAVKVGYPMFWTPIFLGLLSTATVKKWI